MTVCELLVLHRATVVNGLESVQQFGVPGQFSSGISESVKKQKAGWGVFIGFPRQLAVPVEQSVSRPVGEHRVGRRPQLTQA